MRLYRTNRLDDPGQVHDNDELVTAFCADAEAWPEDCPLERALRLWLSRNFGGWDNDDEAADDEIEIMDGILDRAGTR